MVRSICSWSRRCWTRRPRFRPGKWYRHIHLESLTVMNLTHYLFWKYFFSWRTSVQSRKTMRRHLIAWKRRGALQRRRASATSCGESTASSASHGARCSSTPSRRTCSLHINKKKRRRLLLKRDKYCRFLFCDVMTAFCMCWMRK